MAGDFNLLAGAEGVEGMGTGVDRRCVEEDLRSLFDFNEPKATWPIETRNGSLEVASRVMSVRRWAWGAAWELPIVRVVVMPLVRVSLVVVGVALAVVVGKRFGRERAVFAHRA
jgi:hypothetical protein